MKESVVNKFVECWNDKNLSDCAIFLTENVELRSSNVYQMFPESNGVLKGKKTVLSYFNIILEKMPDFIIGKNIVVQTKEDSLLVNATTENGLLNYHVQYFFNADNKIYLIKSDLSETF